MLSIIKVMQTIFFNFTSHSDWHLKRQQTPQTTTNTSNDNNHLLSHEKSIIKKIKRIQKYGGTRPKFIG